MSDRSNQFIILFPSLRPRLHRDPFTPSSSSSAMFLSVPSRFYPLAMFCCWISYARLRIFRLPTHGTPKVHNVVSAFV